MQQAFKSLVQRKREEQMQEGVEYSGYQAGSASKRRRCRGGSKRRHEVLVRETGAGIGVSRGPKRSILKP